MNGFQHIQTYRADYPVVIWAIHRLGGIVTCANPESKIGEQVYQLTTAKVTLLIVHSTVIDTALQAASIVGLPPSRIVILDCLWPSHDGVSEFRSVPELMMVGQRHKWTLFERPLSTGEGKRKIAFLCWSSGTTGKPKAVMIPHTSVIANIIQMATHNQIDKGGNRASNQSYLPGDVALGVLPFYHVAGLIIGLHLSLFCGMSVVVIPKYDFCTLLKSISRHRISHLFLVPPQAVSFCKHSSISRHYYSWVKYVMIGAAPVSREVQEKLHELFPAAQIGQAYGLTEMTTTIAMVSPKQRGGPLGSGGRLLPGVNVRVLRPDGTLARNGERGELVVKGPSIALGYFDNPEATIETFIDGWVHTGDEVIVTSNREIFVLDRVKEILKVRGFQVAPAELEGCLLSHPDVHDVCVVGIPDEYNGELPIAYVVLSGAATECLNQDASMSAILRSSIMKYLAVRKTSYKHLYGVRFIEAIPKNGSGKILRRKLREHAKCNPISTSRANRFGVGQVRL